MEEAGLTEGAVLLEGVGAVLLEGEGVGEEEKGGKGEGLKSALALFFLLLGVKECALGYLSASGPAPSLWALGRGFLPV